MRNDAPPRRECGAKERVRRLRIRRAQNTVQKFPSPVLGDTRFLLLTPLILGSLRLWDVSRGTWGRLLRYAEGGEEKAAGREQKPLRHAPKPTSAVCSVRDDFHPVHFVVCQFLDAERPVRVGITAAPLGARDWGDFGFQILDFGLPSPLRRPLAACCLPLTAYCLLPTVPPQFLAPSPAIQDRGQIAQVLQEQVWTGLFHRLRSEPISYAACPNARVASCKHIRFGISDHERLLCRNR